MKIRDSLTHTLKELPREGLKIYLCGPTVYDDVHIGNVAPVLVFDFLIRYLKEKKISYLYVHNITDIDDKIVDRALESGVSEEVISALYEAKYLGILKSLRVVKPCVLPRVSDHIRDIQGVISRLMDKGYAEMSGNDVVFKVGLVEQYGELSKQKLSELKSVSNFCLWKKMERGKGWYSPWGFGRPGWHTECYAFIDKYCGGRVDVHGGGVDLKFPHHENENVHCRALNNSGLADIWVHVGHLNTQEGKISKSGNNKYLVKDLLKEYPSGVLRLLFLTSHYSHPSLVTDKKLQDLGREWAEFVSSINKYISHIYLLKNSIDICTSNFVSEEVLGFLENDLDLPGVLTWLQGLKKELLKAIKSKDLESIQELGDKLRGNLRWLGFYIPKVHTEDKLKLLRDWREAQERKEWEKADRIREELMKYGLI